MVAAESKYIDYGSIEYTMRFLTFAFIFAISCTNTYSPRAQDILVNSIPIDSLKQVVKDEMEIIDIQCSSKTLNIASTKDELFYPFGIYANFQSFIADYLKDKGDYLIDSIHRGFNILIVQSDINKIELIAHPETTKVELLNAEIKNNNFSILGDIRVGMSEDVFLSIFFSHIPEQCKHVSIVELRSGLAGVWYSFIFTGDTLHSISIKTDYILPGK